MLSKPRHGGPFLLRLPQLIRVFLPGHTMLTGCTVLLFFFVVVLAIFGHAVVRIIVVFFAFFAFFLSCLPTVFFSVIVSVILLSLILLWCLTQCVPVRVVLLNESVRALQEERVEWEERVQGVQTSPQASRTLLPLPFPRTGPRESRVDSPRDLVTERQAHANAHRLLLAGAVLFLAAAVTIGSRIAWAFVRAPLDVVVLVFPILGCALAGNLLVGFHVRFRQFYRIQGIRLQQLPHDLLRQDVEPCAQIHELLPDRL
mmetsp:Transcript_13008/g.48228  ORF Transcript_13008/g.48228 Transcript_13008/m.48228 type:complete len:258 (-) Transcript_13008:1595-2368(-)